MSSTNGQNFQNGKFRVVFGTGEGLVTLLLQVHNNF